MQRDNFCILLIHKEIFLKVMMKGVSSSLLTKTSELRVREVVNVLDGKRLGLASDLEIDLESGRITAIVVPKAMRFMGFLGKEQEYIIPWNNIKKIGVDVILVDNPENESEISEIEK